MTARAESPRAQQTSDVRSLKLPTGSRTDDRSGRIPVYRQIMADLGNRIESGEFREGVALPSEAELAVSYCVSRMTVRQALAGLAEQGLVERRHGSGTLVRHHKLRREAQIPIGLTEEIASRGQTARSHVLHLEEVRPTSIVRYALWIGPRAHVVLFRRLRYADDMLIGMQDSYIPLPFVPGLANFDLENKSLAKVLRDHGLVATYAELTIETVDASPEIADALHVSRGSSLLKSTRTSFLQEGRPLEQTTGWFLGDRYSYRLIQGTPPQRQDGAIP
jgi:GntR family transcriptional regulator